MTPKEQAVELWDKFDEIIALNSWADEKTNIEELVLLPKKCAIIAVNEILKYSSFGLPDMEGVFYDSYWQEVKNELEKL